MKKKFIIIAGIVFAIFLVFLIAICGSAGGNKTITKEELDTTISNISCKVKNGDDITYDMSVISNDISFDSSVQNKQYEKITVNKLKDFKSLGLAFIAKSNEDFTLNISLNKNEETLKTTSVVFKDGKMQSVNLLLEQPIEIKTTDEFTITFSQEDNCSFMFDTLLFFFDEV